MKALFARSDNPISLLIRLATWSRWHHCGILMEDNTVIHATTKKGVVRESFADFQKR